MRELIGAGLAVLSACLYDAGYLLEKHALGEAGTEPVTPAGIWRLAVTNRRWLVGFTAMLAGLALQIGALTLAPVPVVQPILAGGLIALAAAGSALLGEQLNRRHRSALGLVVVAMAAVALSAHGSAALARWVPGRRFAALGLVLAVLGVLCARAGLSRRSGGGGRFSLAGLAGTALGAGLLYGLGAMAEKAVATRLVRSGLARGAWDALATPYPWIFVGVTLAGMFLFQVGLQAHPASLMASLTNLTSTVAALLGSAVVFSEPVLPSGAWVLVRVAGFACMVAAVVILAVDSESVPSAEGADLARPDHAVAP